MSVASPTETASAVNNDATSASQRKRSVKAAAASIQRPFSLRGFTSMLLVLGLVAMLASGIALYIAPRGRVANMTDWTVFSLSRGQWIALHINASILFVVASVTHLTMNWSRLVGYVKKRSRLSINMKREIASALVLTSVLFAATILSLPPINIPVDFKFTIRDSWEQVNVNRDSVDNR